MARKKYYGKGKLMLFGEYAVLDGAKCLAIPTSYGQYMEIKPHRGSDLVWESYDEAGELWFEAQISLYDFSSIRTSDPVVSKYVQKLLKGAVQYNTEFLNNWNGYKVINRLEFPRNWGLGSSSTLTFNVANWAGINPFHLHFRISNGSGYDIACANAEHPLTYQIKEDELSFTELDFDPGCLDQIHFVHLGKKQNSAEAVAKYSKNAQTRTEVARQITELTEAVLACDNIKDLMQIMADHERIIGSQINRTPIKEELFSDFNGAIKSLGAWGGDFIMVVSEMSETEVDAYFTKHDYSTVIPYHKMIHNLIAQAAVA